MRVCVMGREFANVFEVSGIVTCKASFFLLSRPDRCCAVLHGGDVWYIYRKYEDGFRSLEVDG